MKKVKAGIIGIGYIGLAHIEALRRLAGVEIAAIGGSNKESTQQKAESLGISNAYGDYREMLKDPSISVIHNCTPNVLHLQINKDILNAGKHCISEKPLGMNPAESAELVRHAKSTNLINAVNFNYRYYPLVQHAKHMIQENELGRVFSVLGCYTQDWLLYESDWNWRLDPQCAGIARVMSDIGSHWFDLIQFVTGKKIKRVFADVLTVHEYRIRPDKTADTFIRKSSSSENSTKIKIESEDCGHVLIQFADGSKGSTFISQTAAGRKNHIVFEIHGTEKSIWWDHERPNELMTGHRDKPNEVMLKDPSLLGGTAGTYAHYPAGHNEGYPSAVKNFCRNVYRHITGEGSEIDYATFLDGYISDVIVEAVIKSSRTEKWIDIITAV